MRRGAFADCCASEPVRLGASPAPSARGHGLEEPARLFVSGLARSRQQLSGLWHVRPLRTRGEDQGPSDAGVVHLLAAQPLERREPRGTVPLHPKPLDLKHRVPRAAAGIGRDATAGLVRGAGFGLVHRRAEAAVVERAQGSAGLTVLLVAGVFQQR